MGMSSRKVRDLPPPVAVEASGRVADPDSRYPDDAIRIAIEEWHYLDPTLAILLDIEGVYPYLGKEWRDVFALLSEGYSTQEIGRYFRRFSGKPDTPKSLADYGHDVVARLVREIQKYLSSPTVGQDPRAVCAKGT